MGRFVEIAHEHNTAASVQHEEFARASEAKEGASTSIGSPPTPDTEKEAPMVVSDAKPQKAHHVPLRALFRHADRTDKTLMIVGSIAAFANGAGLPSFSEILGRLINRLAENPPDVEHQVAQVAAIMVYVGIGVGVLSVIQVACWMIAAERQTARLRQEYFDALLRQDAAFFDANKPGGLAARLVGDTRVIRAGINDKVATGIMNFGMFLFGYAFGFYRSWKLTLVMMSILPVVGIITCVMSRVLKTAAKAARENFAVAGEVSEEVLQSVRTVQIFGGEKREVSRFAGKLGAAGSAGMKKEMATTLGVGSCYGIIFASYALAFWFGSYLIRHGDNNVGEITAVFFSVIMGSFGIGFVLPTVSGLAEAQGAAHKIHEVLDRKPAIDIRARGRQLDEIRGRIEFKNVAFAYPTRKDSKLFDKLNLTVEAGQCVAFTGASGCGKSSIVALVQRLYDPDRGQVLVDGVDLKELDLAWWRSNVGVVEQDPALFGGSVMENVRLGKADATDEEVHDACKRANIHETIMSLPDRYDTKLGIIGSQLSGGQRQRLAIARAIVRRPRVLILDEATSALDRQSEAEVQEALNDVMREAGEGGCRRLTVLVIAHRLTTIRHADRIYFLEHDYHRGSVVAEAGTFDQLIAQQGRFAGMAAKQSVATAAAEETDEDLNEETALVNTTPARSRSTMSSGSLRRTRTAVIGVDHAPFGQTQGSPCESDARAPYGSEPSFRRHKSLEQRARDEVRHAQVPLRRVVRLTSHKSWAVLVGLVGSLIAGGVYPAYAVVLSKMLEVLGTETDAEIKKRTPFWAGMFVLIGGCVFVGWALQGFYAVAGEYVTTKLRVMLFKNLLRQDQAFFDTPGRDAGSLGKVLEGDTEAVHLLWGPALGYKVQMACNLIVGCIVALVYSWRLALVTMCALPLLVSASLVQQVLLQRNFSQSNGEDEDDENGVVTESLRNMRTVAAFDLGTRQSNAFRRSNEADLVTGKRTGVIAGVMFGLSQFVIFGAFALSFWYGGRLMAHGQERFSHVLVASMAVLMGALGAGEAGGFASKTQDARRAARSVFALIDHEPAIDPDGSGEGDIGDGATVEFQDVTFVYPARPKVVVLKSFSDTITNGTTAGLMGTTGCGKSTIIQLLGRFYDPVHGSITINGHDLRGLELRSWRSGVGAVFQEPSLLSGTIRDNIKYGRPNATDEEMEAVARLAAVHEEVLGMSAGYDTDVGYQGRALSGGQKQRIAIARALLRRPRLLLLDEATSALDNTTEARVMQGLEAYRRDHGATVVSVAHRLTTIQGADKIILMEQGVVLEEGSHEDLMQARGHYAHRFAQYLASTQ